MSIDRENRVNDRTLTGYVILCALFIGGLLANVIIATKIVALGDIIIPASAFFWAATFPLSDICAEVYGRKYGHRMVLGGFVGLLIFLAAVQSSIAMPPADFWLNQEPYETILGATLRIIVAAVISYAAVQFVDVQIFSFIRRKFGNKRLWLRNNLSTMISQTLANTIFLTLAFWGTIPLENWLHLYATNLLTRFALLALDTPVVYAGVHLLYRAYPELRDERA